PEIEKIFFYSDGKAYVYSENFVKIAPAEFNPTLSQFEKARMAQNFFGGNRKYLFVDHYLFYPLKDPTKGGFAGVSFTEGFVGNDLIAGSVAKIVSIYHGNTASPDIVFTVSDENN